MTDKMIYGVIGTAVGSVGASLSVTELQAIISICVTIAGFLISVVAPLIIKLVKWYKKSKEDGKIDAENITVIVSTGDVSINLAGKMEDYSITAKTGTGKTNVSSYEMGNKKVDIKTSTGDIVILFNK